MGGGSAGIEFTLKGTIFFETFPYYLPHFQILDYFLNAPYNEAWIYCTDHAHCIVIFSSGRSSRSDDGLDWCQILSTYANMH